MKKLLTLILLVPVIFIITGCGSPWRFHMVEGKVVTFPELRESFVIEITADQIPDVAPSVEGVYVTLDRPERDYPFPSPEERARRKKELEATAEPPREKWEPFSWEILTNPDGYFWLNHGGFLKKAELVLTVSKEGYETVTITYLHNVKCNPYKFLIFLKPLPDE